jgi:SAM-dependent methyltransferase
VSRSKEFLKSLAGPHVVFALAAGALKAGAVLRWESLAVPIAFGALAAASAILAKRLTGNTLASACTGGIVAFHPAGLFELGHPLAVDLHVRDVVIATSAAANLLSAACGLLAAGIRLLPSAELENAPLFGRREWIALALLVLGAVSGPAILPMPLLILAADLAFAPVGWRAVFRRTGRHFVFHCLAVAPAWFLTAWMLDASRLEIARVPWANLVFQVFAVLVPQARPDVLLPTAEVFALFSLAVLASIVVIFCRAGIPQKVVVAAAFALVWTAASCFAWWLHPLGVLAPFSALGVFGFALLVATISWRLAIAVGHPKGAPALEEPPIPGVPALRDLVRRARAEPPAAAAVAGPRIESSAGMRSTVETAVAGAVAATLEQIRLAFRGPHPSEPPGTPEQVLWNRLLTQGSGGPAPDEKPAAAVARWREFHAKSLKGRIKPGGAVLCVGATPWPLVAALAEPAAALVLVERSHRAGQIAAGDLAGTKRVTVVRHDGRALKPVGDATVDAFVALVEPTLGLAGDVLALLKEAKRVLKAGGIAAIGFADLASPAAAEALSRSSHAACFTNREGIETLAKLAGFGSVEISSGALGVTSIAWIRS